MDDDGCIAPARVLLVEDHDQFRRFIRTSLANRSLANRRDLQVIAESDDGLDAVSKCLELQPNVVLMDIGLPGQNGIEAARRIRALVPACRIVFLTQETSPEIVQEVLNLGAAGYVVKARASSDLIPAITAALEGRQFVSQIAARREDVHAPDQSRAATAAHNALSAHLRAGVSHAVHYHPDEPSLLAGFAGFIESTLAAGNAVIAITTGPHRVAILRILKARGLDVDAAIETGRFTPLDVDETLAEFMVDDLPDSARFFSAADVLMKSVKARNRDMRVLACGEMAPTLWARGNAAAAIQVEHLWDRLIRIHDLETHCGYMLTGSQRSQDAGIYDQICAEHSSIHYFCH